MSEGLTHRQRTAGMLRAMPSSQLWNREHISNARQTAQVLMHVCIHVYLHIHIYMHVCVYKEVIFLRGVNKMEYMERFGGRKGKGEME